MKVMPEMLRHPLSWSKKAQKFRFSYINWVLTLNEDIELVKNNPGK